MNNLIVILLLLTLCTSTSGRVILTTCARMDTPILEKAAQASCIASCKFQNCGTGHCERRGRPVCVCSRCDKGGGSWPSVSLRRRTK
uniref:INVERT_DEFENSINS domain-containing protein n=1 Tax=Syphacia muris TaxID=451379 RepID=A0A0N5ACL6_9BILA